jgi:ribosome maturation factor RimP
LLAGLSIIDPVIPGFFWLYHLYRVKDAGGFESGLAHFFLCLFQGGAKTNKFLRDNTDMSGSVVEKVQAFAETLLPSMGLELVEVQFRLEGHGWVLRLFIDGKEGITVDHCSRVSREVSDFLEVEDLIAHAYHLEVSSPGLERSLHSMNDFQRYVGKKAKLKMREDVEGQKVLIGDIVRAEDETVELLLEDGTRCQVAFEQIRKARLSL